MSNVDRRTKVQEANHAAATGDYESAIELFGQAIDMCTEDGHVLLQSHLLRQRAKCNSNLSRFESALNDAEAAVECLGDMTTPKSIELRRTALIAIGSAAYSMCSYAKALTMFTSAQDLGAVLPSAVFEGIQARLNEEADGSYDFEEMLSAASCFAGQNPSTRNFKYGSFVANTEIRTTEASGRGLFAAKNFQLGDLVLCERAFAISIEQEDGSDPLPNLQSKVVDMLKYSPLAKDRLYVLTDGEDSPARHPGMFSFPMQVRTMVRLNAFEFIHIGAYQGGVQEKAVPSEPKRGSAALWIQASLFNHSCVGNVARSHIGDMMVCRAAKPIMKGEELTLSYINSSVEYPERKSMMEQAWGFTCACKLCLADAMVSEEQHGLRANLIEQATRFVKDMYSNKTIETMDVEQAEQLLLELQSTYSNPAYRGLPLLPLIDLGRFLAETYLHTDIVEFERAMIALLTDLGLVRNDTENGLVLDFAGAGNAPEYALGSVLVAAKALHSAKMDMHKAVFVGLSKGFYQALFGAMRGFEQFADPNGTGWLTDEDADYD